MTPHVAEQWIMPLNDSAATVEDAGGKGASLAALTVAGFPVPPGFVITTDAYRQFVAENDLRRIIDLQTTSISEGDSGSLERAAATIQAAFQHGVIPAGITRAIEQAYAALGSPELAVAVRSSATAEDLPGLSFAGQQETRLNVRGQAAVRDAVRLCWASLWTARAITYRRQMVVAAEMVAMAVVVQEMVPAEASGVLFTANPVTGHRGQLVIEAATGLGEDLVGGAVTPESYVISRSDLEVERYVPGQSRRRESRPAVSAAHEDERDRDADGAVLAAPFLHELVRLGLQAEEQFNGLPQDVEWAVASGKIWILQSRPITNLPIAPIVDATWESPLPGTTWVRRQVVEHMPEPLSPLFAEIYLREGLEQSLTAIVRDIGLGDFFKLIVDGPFFTTVNGYGYSRGDINLPPEAVRYLARAFILGPIWLFRHGIDHWRDTALPRYLSTITRWQRVSPALAPDAELLRGVQELATADAVYWFPAAIAIGTAKVSDWILDGFLHLAAPDRSLQASLFLRGFPSKTLEAEAELDAIARRARETADLSKLVTTTAAERLLDSLPGTPTGRQLREDLEHYLARHGHQIYNLDFVAPTLVEAPLPVLLGLKAAIRDPGADALARQHRVARERDRMTEETARSFDPLRRWLFRRLVRWARRYAPHREDALYYVGAGWPLLRRFALELGRRLAAAGMLEGADDIFFLQRGEIAAAIAARADHQQWTDLAQVARERRDLREQQQRLHPPAAVPPTSRMHIGRLDFSVRETQRRNAPDAMVLRGFAVSPGRVTAPASVIRSPADLAQMEPGTILVCPTTTPAWTPLFAQARELVTDIGGVLAHGSIVAREYGIPAVMGTGNATQRITSGQQITLDGTEGTVTLTDY